MDRHTPRFTTTQTAKAAGFEPSAFRNYISRGLIPIPEDAAQWALENGRANAFNLRTVYQAAIAKRLIMVGVSREEAFHAGSKFAHVGDGGAAITRLPGELFPQDLTVLVFCPEIEAHTGRIRVTNMTRQTDVFNFFSGSDTSVVVLINAVVQDVHRNLGIEG